MGKNIRVQLPSGEVVQLYVSNSAKSRAEQARIYSQRYGVQFDPNNLRRYAEKERKVDQARQAQIAAINEQRPDYAKNVKNYAMLSSAARKRLQQINTKPVKQERPDYAKRIKNWDNLSPAIKAKLARQAGYTDLKGDLYLTDKKGVFATQKAATLMEQDKAIRMIKQQQAQPIQSTQPITQRQKTGFEKRVEGITEREEGINKRMKQLEQAFDLSLYFGTAKTKAGRWAQKFASEALTLPTKFTVGAVDFLELASEKLAATAEGLVVSRKETLKELGRAAKETPKEVVKAFDIRDPATAAQVAAIFVGGLKAGKARAIERAAAKAKPKPPPGQKTLTESLKQIAKDNKAKTAILNKLSKKLKAIKKKVVAKSNKTNLDIAKRENNLGRSLTIREKIAVKKSLARIDKPELASLLKDIIKRERNIGRPLRQREIETILRERYESRKITGKIPKTPKTKMPSRIGNLFKPKGKKAGARLELEKVFEKTREFAIESSERIGRIKGRVKLPKNRIRYLPVLTVGSASVLGTKAIDLTKAAQQPDIGLKPAQSIKSGQAQKQAQGQQLKLATTESLVFKLLTTAATAVIAEEVLRRSARKPAKGSASSQRADYSFKQSVYLARQKKRGIYLPDLYAVLTGEKATAKQTAKLVNPQTVFSGIEARPIVG